MFEDLRGKVVLVTGASTGIGAAAASAFGAAGAKVAVHYNASRGRRQGGGRLDRRRWRRGGGVPCQERHAVRGGSTSCSTTWSRGWGRIDVLVNNAGNLFGRRAFADADDTFLDELLNLNVRSVVHLSRASPAGLSRRTEAAATSST